MEQNWRYAKETLILLSKRLAYARVQPRASHLVSPERALLVSCVHVACSLYHAHRRGHSAIPSNLSLAQHVAQHEAIARFFPFHMIQLLYMICDELG